MSLNMTSAALRRPMPVRDLHALRTSRAMAELELRRQQAIMRLARQLPSTLDVHAMFSLFAGIAGDAFPFDGLRFMRAAGDPPFAWGVEAPHHAEYSLRLNDEGLGEMVLMRDRPFAEYELHVFEDLLAYLLYPLRNGLLYQDTLLMASIDGLTGVGNRKSFDESIQRELARVERHGGELSLLILDMDGFKSVNDTHGHVVGDALLRHFAAVIKATARTSDMVFRFGGDEFAVLMPETGHDGAARLVQRLREAMANAPMVHGDLHVEPRSSMGLAHWRADTDVTALVEQADAALYADKRERRASMSAA